MIGNGFRVLAIRPLEYTNIRFRKNLTNQVVYKFYQDFKFVDENGIEILESNENLKVKDIRIVTPDFIPDIYSSNNLNFNVSAIVGTNGSGKSSLIDFYNLVLYYLSCNYYKTLTSTSEQLLIDLRLFVHFIKEYYNHLVEFLPQKATNIEVNFSVPTEKLTSSELLQTAKNLISILKFKNIQPLHNFKDNETKANFYNLLWRYFIEGKKNYGVYSHFIFHEIGTIYNEINQSFIYKLESLIEDYNNETEFDRLLQKEFNFQLYYQVGTSINKFEKVNEVLSVSDDQFYTIHLNYSLHSLNSNNLGTWIYKLFHKNDGYQTPNVINPYRNEGNIDINSEIELSTDRLVYNILDQYRISSNALILDKYKFKRFILKLKNDNIYPLYDLDVDYKNKEDFLSFIGQVPRPFKFVNRKNVSILDYCVGYLIKKFHKIASTYMTHFYQVDNFSQLDFASQIEELEKWQVEKAKKFLLDSNSHVARKFNQTYNFLLNYEDIVEELDFLNDWNINDLISLSKEELNRWIILVENKYDLKSKGTHEFIMQLFPAIFDIDIEFDCENSEIKLSDLSSGEQQYIFNLNTITYHINNLKTVEFADGTTIKKYNHVNIILDEIELYYHPEYQKKLVKDVIYEVKRLDSLGSLKNFNIIFLTHSPFILSDIPDRNILRLENGKPSLKIFNETFAANIHDILSNDFFLNGFMGEFANNYISDLINEIDTIEKDKLTEKDYNFFLQKINIVGEPVIKNSIRSFLDKKFSEILILTKRRRDLEEELSIIKKKLQENGTNRLL